ncbi:MAG TPA: HIT family protein [Pseudomonadales bacterium]|nr:HIT family protein [Pseudomonadales bacterium]
MAFELHPRLAADGIEVGKLALSTLLLNNDSRFPWCILVPRLEGLRDFHEVPAARRSELFSEIERVSIALGAIGRADKMNVAALGNMVPQLHIHVIARRTDDAAWPTPVWNAPGAVPYADAQPLIAQLRTKLGLNLAPDR